MSADNGSGSAAGTRHAALQSLPEAGEKHASTPPPRHDSFILEQSGLVRIMHRICRRLGEDYCMYGDPAYPQSRWIASPFRQVSRQLPLNTVEARFNAWMSSLRIPNEWGFGRIKTNFAYLDFSKGMKPYQQDLASYWPAAQILQNCHTCCYGCQMAMYYDCRPPELEEYLRMGENLRARRVCRLVQNTEGFRWGSSDVITNSLRLYTTYVMFRLL